MKRHSSVGKFVQKETNKAEIRITISNRDEEPYRHEVYGDKIVFERTIYANGVSHYNIKNGKSMATVCNGSKSYI